MTISAAISTTLKADGAVSALAGDRIHLMKAPQDTDNPSIVYNLIDDAEDTKSAPQITHTVIQVDCYGDTAKDASDLYVAVKAALDELSGTIADVVIDIIIYQNYSTVLDPSGSLRYKVNFRARINV